MRFGKDGFRLTFDIPTYRDLPVYNEPSIYHYTGHDALLSIIGNNQLWATNVRFLNDHSEFQHGVDLIAEIWRETRSEYDKSIREQIDVLLATIQSIYPFDKFFIVSASSEAEDVSQFERYGEYSVEFDSQQLIYSAKNRASFPNDMKLLSLPPGWRQVAYERDDKASRIAEFFRAVERRVVQHPDWQPMENEILTIWFGWWYVHLISVLKDRSFKSEAEARFLMVTEATFDEVFYRTSRYDENTPYTKLAVIGPDDSTSLLPIRRILVSPQKYAEANASAIKSALTSAGHDVPVTVSTIPLR